MPARQNVVFVNDGPVVARCNVDCNEDPVLNMYGDSRTLILCKYCRKLEMNHDSNYVNCFQSLYYCTDVIRYGKMKITDSIEISTALAHLANMVD